MVTIFRKLSDHCCTQKSNFCIFRYSGDSNWQESDKERIYNWVNVSGLARATYYEMIVVASNGKVEQGSEKEEILTTGGVGKPDSYNPKLKASVA